MLTAHFTALGHKTKLRVLPRPVAHSHERRTGFGIYLYPRKSIGDVTKSPGINDAHGIGQMRHRGPHKEERVWLDDLPHR